MAKAPDRSLFNTPYVFPAQMGTFGTTQVGGGALIAGQVQPFADQAFNNGFSKPFIVTRIKFFVGRVAGGNEFDSDYNEVLARIESISDTGKFSKAPTALSVLCDRQRREWILQPGSIMLGSQNSGLTIEMTVLNGAIGAPYNLSVALHGYFQGYQDVTASMMPPGAEG